MKVVVQNNHTVTVTTCQKTTHSAKYCAYHSNASQPSGAFATTDSFSQKQAVALATGTSVNQICSPQCSKCCTHHSLSSVVLTTAYQVLYSPQSTKCCTCHTLPSVVLATVYQVLYLPHSTKCCISHSLPSVGLTSLPRVVFATTKCCICHSLPRVILATVYQALDSPVYQELYLPQSTKCCTCHSLPSVACYKHLIQRSTMPVTDTLVHNSANCLSCYGHYIQLDVPATRRDASFNPMCLPQEKNPPHSNKQFSC